MGSLVVCPDIKITLKFLNYFKSLLKEFTLVIRVKSLSTNYQN